MDTQATVLKTMLHGFAESQKIDKVKYFHW